MQANNVTRDTQAESQSRLAPSSALRLPEPVEHVWKKLGRDADSRISHGQHRLFVGVFKLDGDSTGRMRELHGVPGEVPDDLFQSASITKHDRRGIERHIDFDLLCTCFRSDGIDCGLDDFGESDRFAGDVQTIRHDA